MKNYANNYEEFDEAPSVEKIVHKKKIKPSKKSDKSNKHDRKSVKDLSEYMEEGN